MPRKVEKACKTDKPVCDLCCSPVGEGEDALRCEGSCNMWLHRYCGGVSASHFKDLAGSSTSFVCLYCSQKAQQDTISKLQSEVAALKVEVVQLRAALGEVRGGTVDALVGDIQQLKSTMNDVVLKGDRADDGSAVPWSEVVRRERQKRSKATTARQKPKANVAAQTHQDSDIPNHGAGLKDMSR